MNGPCFVKDGATLTILAGTVVRGQPRTAPPQQGVTLGTPGALIVTRDGRLVANGAPTNPIIFTTAATDNDMDDVPDDANMDGLKDPYEAGDVFWDDNPAGTPRPPLDGAGRSTTQLWGGLVLLGRAPTNLADKCGVGWGQCTIEGLTFPGFSAADASYGGILPHDSSGILRYVSVRHGGDQFGEANELNGVSLGGVGDGTILENVEVYVNWDDGFEWFGGTVNGKNLVVEFVGDDMFDVDEGFTGVNQFLFGVMPFFNETADNDPNTPGVQVLPFGFGSGDKAAELDGENYRPDNALQNDNLTTRVRVDAAVLDATPWPISNPAFYNMTIIGTTLDPNPDFVLPAVSVAGTNRGIQFRNGFAGDVFNSIVVNTGAETGIEVDLACPGPPGFCTQNNADNDLINVVCSTLDDGANFGALPEREQTVVDNGNALALLLGGVAPASNNAVNPAGPADFLVNEDTSFNPMGDASGYLSPGLKPVKINPRPASAGFPPPPIAGCPGPTGTGLDSSATFRGAFPSAGALWAAPWTVLSRSGLMQ
jgi:hypothetical protein